MRAPVCAQRLGLNPCIPCIPCKVLVRAGVGVGAIPCMNPCRTPCRACHPLHVLVGKVLGFGFNPPASPAEPPYPLGVGCRRFVGSRWGATMGGMERLFETGLVDPASLFGYEDAGVLQFTRKTEELVVRELEDRLGVGHQQQIAVQWTARVQRSGREVEEMWTPPRFVRGAGMFTCTAWVVGDPQRLGGVFELSPIEAANPVIVMSFERQADRELEKRAAEADQVITSRPAPKWTIERLTDDGSVAEARWQPGEPVDGAVRVVYRVEALAEPLPAGWVRSWSVLSDLIGPGND